MSKEKLVLCCLQERNGSSLAAITKFVGEKHPGLPGPWKKVLSNNIRKLTTSGKLVKVGPRVVIASTSAQDALQASYGASS